MFLQLTHLSHSKSPLCFLFGPCYEQCCMQVLPGSELSCLARFPLKPEGALSSTERPGYQKLNRLSLHVLYSYLHQSERVCDAFSCSHLVLRTTTSVSSTSSLICTLPAHQLSCFNYLGLGLKLCLSPHVCGLPLGSHRFLQSSDKRLSRLKPYSHSPVVWFRNPYVHILLVGVGGRKGLGRIYLKFILQALFQSLYMHSF